eukprot:5197857-Amphidinium_carterae.1
MMTQDIAEIMTEIDTNGDGEIDFQDFPTPPRCDYECIEDGLWGVEWAYSLGCIVPSLTSCSWAHSLRL